MNCEVRKTVCAKFVASIKRAMYLITELPEYYLREDSRQKEPLIPMQGSRVGRWTSSQYL
jgi:hypothetical protein